MLTVPSTVRTVLVFVVDLVVGSAPVSFEAPLRPREILGKGGLRDTRLSFNICVMRAAAPAKAMGYLVPGVVSVNLDSMRGAVSSHDCTFPGLTLICLLIAHARHLLVMLRSPACTSVLKFWKLEGLPAPLWGVGPLPHFPSVVWPLLPLSSCLLFIPYQALF